MVLGAGSKGSPRLSRVRANRRSDAPQAPRSPDKRRAAPGSAAAARSLWRLNQRKAVLADASAPRLRGGWSDRRDIAYNCPSCGIASTARQYSACVMRSPSAAGAGSSSARPLRCCPDSMFRLRLSRRPRKAPRKVPGTKPVRPRCVTRSRARALAILGAAIDAQRVLRGALRHELSLLPSDKTRAETFGNRRDLLRAGSHRRLASTMRTTGSRSARNVTAVRLNRL